MKKKRAKASLLTIVDSFGVIHEQYAVMSLKVTLINGVPAYRAELDGRTK